jgi:hypothetical protein
VKNNQIAEIHQCQAILLPPIERRCHKALNHCLLVSSLTSYLMDSTNFMLSFRSLQEDGYGNSFRMLRMPQLDNNQLILKSIMGEIA